MPIYAYKCAACGHAKDVLQKISDAPLTTCPACGAEQFTKQLTAAGFQLKGSGWYATDFKGSGASATAATAASSASASTDAGGAASESTSGSSTAEATATPGGCGASCACH
jgi:putative FmdB family regulatory protein